MTCNTTYDVLANMRLTESHSSGRTPAISLFLFKNFINTQTGVTNWFKMFLLLYISLYISHRKIKSVCTSTSFIAQESLVDMFLCRRTCLVFYIRPVLVCYIHFYFNILERCSTTSHTTPQHTDYYLPLAKHSVILCT